LILQALNDHYQRLLDDPESGVAPPGYSPAKVSHAVVLDEEGNLLDILALSDVVGKKRIPRILLVPEQVKRTSRISANILCDSISYVIGIERTKHGEIACSHEKYADFKTKNSTFLKDIRCKEATVVSAFLEKWNPEKALKNPIILANMEELLAGSSVVFKLDGAGGYAHENSDIRNCWERSTQDTSNDVIGQCLITGEFLPTARLHPLIKGVIGAQTSGAAVVSFNSDAFTSYGKTQSFNAPVSMRAAFAYGTALNYLIASNSNHVRLADTTIVFWADKKGARLEENILSWCLDPVETEEKDKNGAPRIDPIAARQAKTILERVKAGLPVEDATFDSKTTCYLLGLAPNAARLSVRFWQVSSFGDVLEKIGQHYADMNITGIDKIGGIVSPWRTLKAVAIQEDSKNIPPLLGGQFLKTIMSGQMYPQGLYNSALQRCRIGGEHGGVSPIRAAIIKAFLLRKYRLQRQVEKEALITVSLNENNTKTAYLLGRLFSLLEKAQKDALGNSINATIRDRYFGAASATPGAVFPLLLRLSRHHIAKAEYGNLTDRKIQDVMNNLDKFPAHLSMEDQGQFILGYYHQNQANYSKTQIIES
jgi:CRISPR-associated protein Csd1